MHEFDLNTEKIFGDWVIVTPLAKALRTRSMKPPLQFA